MMECYTRIDGQEYEAKFEIPVHAASKSEQSGGVFEISRAGHSGFTLIYLTSSKKVMGKYANTKGGKIVLWSIGLVVTFLNIALLISAFQ